MTYKEISYGPVVVIDGPHKGRIGYYDDDDTEFDEGIDWNSIPEDEEVEGRRVCVVYFGDFFLAKGYFIIDPALLRPVTTADLMKRREELHNLCGRFSERRHPELDLDDEEKLDYFVELHYVDSTLVDRMVEVRYSNVKSGKKVFISHSSKDKAFAKWVGTDLKAAGHSPWLDEWSISIGESIPQKISEGIQGADFVIVVLSGNATLSRWVEREWHAKYWNEVESGSIQVLPILYQDCVVPELLKTKKYADFRNNYNDGLEDVLLAIKRLSNDNETS